MKYQASHYSVVKLKVSYTQLDPLVKSVSIEKQ